MEILWKSHRFPVESLWKSHRFPVEILWTSHRFPMEIPIGTVEDTPLPMEITESVGMECT